MDYAGDEQFYGGQEMIMLKVSNPTPVAYQWTNPNWVIPELIIKGT